jgi:hypothetical protein
MSQVASLLKSTKSNVSVTPIMRLGAYTYNPKEDITPYEVSRLIELFTFAFHPATHNYDYETTINKYNLTRHFEKKETS